MVDLPYSAFVGLGMGIPALDWQHQGLFRTLYHLDEAMREGRIVAELDVVMDSLQKYAQHHFQDEEAHMRRIRYPGLDAHAAEHRRFLAQMETLRIAFLANGAQFHKRIPGHMLMRLTHHIRTQDMAYARHGQASRLEPPEVPQEE
ncbi:MAG: hemerythrin family protein [Holophaga sp.]|nr:hemerythrin family protein [Holophaga sp.]